MKKWVYVYVFYRKVYYLDKFKCMLFYIFDKDIYILYLY